jgi:hypothetical protein
LVIGSHDAAPEQSHTVYCIHQYISAVTQYDQFGGRMAIRAALYRTRLGGLRAGAALISLAAAPLQAQTVTVSPIANISIPTKFSLREGTIRVSQKVGFRFGARMTLRFSQRFDVTNTVTYSPGAATAHGAGERIELFSGSHSLAGSAAARYWLRLPGGPLSWELHTGVGMVFRGEPSQMDLFEASTLNAVLGTAVRYRVGQLVSFTLKVQQPLLRVRFGEQDGGTSRPLRMTFGVGLPILERLR